MTTRAPPAEGIGAQDVLDAREQALCIRPVHEEDGFRWTHLVSVELARASLGDGLDQAVFERGEVVLLVGFVGKAGAVEVHEDGLLRRRVRCGVRGTAEEAFEDAHDPDVPLGLMRPNGQADQLRGTAATVLRCARASAAGSLPCPSKHAVLVSCIRLLGSERPGKVELFFDRPPSRPFDRQRNNLG